jgi:hypothetical protein
MKVTITIDASEEHGWTPEEVVEAINDLEGLTVVPLETASSEVRAIYPALLDKAAQYVQKLQGDALWDRTGEKMRTRYRNKVLHILNILEGVGDGETEK